LKLEALDCVNVLKRVCTSKNGCRPPEDACSIGEYPGVTNGSERSPVNHPNMDKEMNGKFTKHKQ
jgi:hypothetical protein